MNRSPRLVLGCALLSASCAGDAGQAPVPTPSSGPAALRRPFPTHTTYAAGTIRPGRRSQAQQDDDVRALYARWKGRYLVAGGTAADGAPLYRVGFGSDDPGRTVSEGQGYGMLIVALMAGHEPEARALFDGLYRFVLAHPSRIDPRLMAWEVPSGTSGTDSAFDGDADIAFALLLADAQWGSAASVNYAAGARRALAGILESTIGPDSRLPMLGDWVEPDDAPYNQYTPRTSDFMPDHFRAFSRFSADGAWDAVVARSQAVVSELQARHSPGSGLLPDFVVPASSRDHSPRPAPAGFLEGPNDGRYYYNACRAPWRLAVDGLSSGDPASLAQARRLAAWSRDATGGDPMRIRAGYRLDGSPLSGSDYFTTAFAAPLGVAAMTDPSFQPWLDDLYDAVRDHPEDYYEDSLALLSLLAMTGNYWAP